MQSLALAEPTQHVRYRWVVGLTLASLGMWMATQTPLQVVLALQLQEHHPAAQDRRTGRGDRGRRHLRRAGHPGGGRAVRPHHARPAAGPVERPAASLDAGHGRAGRGLPGAAGRTGHRARRGPAVVPVQHLPERRVRHAERGHPGPRAGPAAGHGGRLGGHADRARPGPGHDHGGGRARPGPGQPGTSRWPC